MAVNRSGCLLVTLVVLLCISALGNLILLGVVFSSGRMLAKEPPRFDEKLVEKGTGDAKIALVQLRGVISSSIGGSLGDSMVEDMKIALRQAAGDKVVKAIVLAIDSPGGEVTAADVIYNEVLKAREKKPVVIYMESVAASGGYYVACAGSDLIANDTSITGSIGVIIQTLNYQELFGKIGLESVTFKSGKFKDILSGSRAMTPEEKEYVQALVMQIYGKFVGIVAKARKLPEADLRAGIADGRVLSGKDALDAKLIDSLGQLDDAFAKARELGSAPGAAVIGYDAPFALGKALRFLGKAEPAKLELSLPGGAFPHLESGRLYLLPAFYAP